jgi:hypothetical protein
MLDIPETCEGVVTASQVITVLVPRKYHTFGFFFSTLVTTPEAKSDCSVHSPAEAVFCMSSRCIE